MMKTFKPVFSAALEPDDDAEPDDPAPDDAAAADGVDDDDELELEDEHAASRTDTMTRPLVSQAVCLSFISESFQFDQWEKPGCAARCRSGLESRGYPLPEPAGQGRRAPAES